MRAPTHPFLLTDSSVAASRPEARSSSLDSSTKLVRGSGWHLRLYQEAAEASGAFRYARRQRAPSVGPAENPERSRAEAARRAHGRVRRYCAANGLNRLGTLTYAGNGCHDPAQVREDVGRFIRVLRREVGNGSFPYIWTTEWHKSGHGLHVHFAVGRFIQWRMIQEVWGHGFVWIALPGSARARAGVLAESRGTARYLAKYIGKDFAESDPGLHRYDVAQGFAPRAHDLTDKTLEGVIGQATAVIGSRAEYVSTSDAWENWFGPRAVFLSWNR
jgi:hypothetical protein